MKTIVLLLICASATFASLAQNIVQGEYFIDTDLGEGNNTHISFTSSVDNTFPFTIDLSSYSPGYHKLYIRTKDSEGNWSFTSRRNVEVYATDNKTTFASGEYFIDADPGFGLATPVSIMSPDSALLQNFSAVTSTLTEGYHKLYGRFKDNVGRWSQTFRRNMEVYKNADNKIINGEYFFRNDNGFGDCVPVAFSSSSDDGSFVMNISKSKIPTGADTLFIRVRADNSGNWSITKYINNISKALPLTLLNFTAIKENNQAKLNWQTTNEINTSYFNIQRSTDAIHFSNIGLVNATNQKEINNYSYTDDMSGIQNAVLYYRLQETDLDGEKAYSKIVAINPDKNIEAYVIYPNPVNEYFNLIASKPGDLQGAVLSVVDLSGRILLHQKLIPAAVQKIAVPSLAKGVYLVKINKVTGMVTLKLLKE